MSSLGCQTLTFTGKRKDDAESMDQAPKRTKNMGRPPILTESQKRKLVRLYLFTNLDMDDIGKIMGFRHKTPKKRTLQHVLRETLNDGYHLHRPKDRAARKNRLLQVSFARGDETSNSGSQRSPQFRIISTPTPKETNSESRVSNASSANPSKGTAKDNTAQRDATGLGASTHDDDPDWINLVHWDEDYICQQTPLQGARGEHHTTNGDETRINSAAAMTLPLSITQSPMQLSYTLDDLQEDIRRFVKQGQMDLDGLLTDSMDTETETEDPVPTFELGRSLTNDLSDGCVDDTSAQGSDQTEKEVFPDSSSSNGLDFSPRTQCRDNYSSIASYGGISSIIQHLSDCSAGHKSDIMHAFRATARSHHAPADYHIPAQNSEVTHAAGSTWNLFDCAVATDRPSTRMSIKDITTVLTRAIRDSNSTQHSSGCFESLKSNDGMDRFGNTLLHLAAFNRGNFTTLDALITNANIHRANSSGETFMHVVQPWAIGNEMPILVQTLESLGFPFARRDYMGRTCIHVLLEKGARPEHLAPYAHLLKITNAEWPMKLRPDEDPWGFKNLISDGYEDLQPIWEETQRTRPEYYLAGRNGELDVDRYDCNGETELMRTCRENDPSLSEDFYENLIAMGANVHYRHWSCATPLLLAVKNGNLKATKVLLRHHSNLHARDTSDRGILTWAKIARDRWPERYANIIACEALIIDAGAVMSPTMFDEWNFKADYFSPTMFDKCDSNADYF
ncbi:MAG: hypothetical protein Q9203_001451 [Teloschistes exilis]